ncbi:hypothetical protein BN946_scf185043.g143 [Trametes cinnabarina]|uniref:Uncharacterized protein n=1 Tax=Pycnoporus cinnabarinus TaxID=5643 RepID=A0A060SNR4_PYCCI|nr:hypothetical protein BN946_scf185043.g143 [Trametes cinnabarina]
MSSVLPPIKPSATQPLPGVEGDALYSASSTSTATLSPAPRPNFVRRETDQILSYYQSEHAGRSFDYATAAAEHAHSSSSTTAAQDRKPSTFSSASEYSDSDLVTHGFFEREHPKAASGSSASHSSSSTTTPRVREPSSVPCVSNHSPEDDHDDRSASLECEHRLESARVSPESQLPTPVSANVAPPPSANSARADGAVAGHSRRPSVPTEGGADRRRLAIVEMDSTASLSIARKRSKGLNAKSSSSSLKPGNPSSPSMSTTGTTLSSRRGVHIGGLALVAPPDASPKTYTNLTPPSTAPVYADRASHPPPAASSHYHHTHARSASEAVNAGSSTGSSLHQSAIISAGVAGGGRSRHLHHKSSRDVGIVGLALSSASTASDSLGPASPTSDIDDYHHYHAYVQNEGLGVPVFQTPAKSRSPSPGSGGGATPDLSDTSSMSAHHRSPVQRLLSTPIFGMEDGIVTPGIGEYKDIQQPVVGPVIVGVSPEFMQQQQQQHQQQPPSQRRADASAAVQQRAFPAQPPPTSVQSSISTSSPSSSSPYLHYKPGVHSTAGPLPPPPRSIFDPPSSTTSGPPPRPPRFHTPVPPGSSARREIEAIKEKLQLPQSVSAALAARTPPATDADKEKRLGHHQLQRTRSDTRDSEESAYSEEDNNNNESSVKLVPSSSVHRREGAFPPSKIFTSPPVQQLVEPPRASEEVSSSFRVERRPLVVIEDEHEEEERRAIEVERSSPADDESSVSHCERKDPERRVGLELRRESSWVSLRQELANNAQQHSSPNGKAAALPNVAVPVSRAASFISGTSSSSSSSASSRLPVPPPKNGKGGSDDEKQGSGTLAPSSFRATLTNLKRFSSLPRTPSRSSRSSKHSTSPSPTPGPRRSFSPPPQSSTHAMPVRRVIPRPTLVSSWPPAMNTRDITVLRSPRERAKAYAEKINELAMYDCGLREWLAVQSLGRPGSHPRAKSQRSARDTLQPSLVPAELGGQPPQGRHVSHGSLASQATFPIRADAYTATDLSLRPIDSIAPTTAPPPLPYPSLAQANLDIVNTTLE